MSRPDVLAALRETRPAAPPALRGRVLEVVAAPQPSRRQLVTRRRTFAALVVAAAAAAGIAAVLLPRGSAPERAIPPLVQGGAVAGGSGSSTRAAIAPVPAPTRLQDYGATLSLRVHGAAAISDGTKRALAIARSLGGFASTVNVSVRGSDGDAILRLRVPVTHVGEAVRRLSALGTIIGESVRVQDRQAGVNATDRTIARLQRELAALRKQKPTEAVKRRITALTAQVQRLQRARANTIRQARLATVSLDLTTRAPAPPPRPVHHGPLHGVLVALTWLGIAALYALAVGGPVALVLAAAWLAARLLRRRRDQRLLDRV